MKKLILLPLLFVTLIVHGQLPSFIKDSLENYVNGALAEWKIPGVAVSIVKDGKVVYMKGFGVKDIETKEPVDENTIFMIGSNTKAFTATALAILHAEKKLSLDDKVQKWFPGFTLYDPWVAKEANIRDLLCHRLGFETFQGDFMYFDSDLTEQEVFEKLAKLKPMYGFRSRWGYTNAAFGVAGEVLRRASDHSWAEFITERIFQPLDMKSTIALTKDITSAPNRSSAHTVHQNTLKKIPYGRLDNMSPAGSISSSVRDLNNWLLVQLDSGKLNGKQVLPAKAIVETWQPHSILGDQPPIFNTGHFSLYGLGWFLQEYNGKKMVSHTGGINGFVTSVTMFPEENLGFVVLTNTDANGFYEALKWEIADAFLGLPYRNYSKMASVPTFFISADRDGPAWKAWNRWRRSGRLPSAWPARTA
jgi:CubicO group peptidase (beta-lactamase class C family)